MPEGSISIDVKPLTLKLKTTFRHAGAARNTGDSLWVRVRRGGISGYGEGCPRPYAAGDDLASSIAWVQEQFSGKTASFHTLDDVTGWMKAHTELIDRFPSAWCAVEMALLDLLSREKSCSVETLLGMAGAHRRGCFSAVLGDDNSWKYTDFVDLYLARGFSDFKIKLSGDLERDKKKIMILDDRCALNGLPEPRVRLDANNLWRGRPDAAIEHIKALGERISAIEEPVGAGDTDGLSRVSTLLNLPVILDESLCKGKDLEALKGTPGRFIANIKVSRVGGIIRALSLMESLKRLDWPVIVGCHVGETSLLTRAALILADAAGGNLAAQEGAYGDHLLQRDPVSPMLKFGYNGVLDLRQPYHYKTAAGLRTVPVENWERGLGMHCRWPATPDSGGPKLASFSLPD